jgi:hypothetical protein
VNRGLLMWVSILAGLQMLSGGAVMIDLVGDKYAGVCVLLVGALQVATVTYQKGLNTPTPEQPPTTLR